MMRKTTVALSLVFTFLPAMLLPIIEVYSQAYPYNPVYRDIMPPEGAEAPIVTIYTPKNSSSHPKNVTLTFYVTLPQTNDNKSIDGLLKIYYRGSWENKDVAFTPGVLGGSIDLFDAPGGSLSVTVYAVGVGYIETGSDAQHTYYDRFEITGYSTVSFIKDVVPPRINVLSPRNATYPSSMVSLEFTVNEPSSKIEYCLDGQDNVTISGNSTLSVLANGSHNVTVYVSDEAGNTGASETICFNVDVPEPFPKTFFIGSVIAVAAVVGLGLLVYYKKRQKTKNE
jgi:hypothetical protein